MGNIVLQGVVNEKGELLLHLPPEVPPGPVEVEIRLSEVAGISASQILASELVGMWEDRADITDSVEYARQLRRQLSRRQDAT